MSFVSIITATFNSENTLKKTLDSLLIQSFKDFEYIIIDGNSTDKTVLIIRNYIKLFSDKGIQFKYISEPDKGIYDAWNKGLKLATGDWICFLGSDDCFYKNALETYHTIISNNKENNYFHSKVELINKNEKVLKVLGSEMDHTFDRYMNIAHVGSFHKKELFNNHEFNLKYKIAGDYEFLLRNHDILTPFFINEITAKMLYGGASYNFQKTLKETLELKLEIKRRNSFLCYFDYYYAYLKALIRERFF